jgi:putative membrane protein insertion efficiency factor
LPTLFLSILFLLLPVGSGADALREPEVGQRGVSPADVLETSPLKLGLQGLVWLYRQGISPVNPDRCGFRPSCSAYGSLAVREQGVFWGVVMTADRLMRCHHLKKPGPFTLLLPDGKILDLPPPRPLPEFLEP